MLDEGETDVFLLLIEAVKTSEKFKRVAEKALKAGKPLDRRARSGRSTPGSRAVASHTAALAGSQAAYRAMFERYGLIEGGDFEEMLDLAAGFLACGDRMPAGNRVGICTASGGAGVWMADACAAAGLEVPVLDDATRATIDVHLPSYATSQNPVDSTAQGVQKLGYAKFARLVAHSPSVDGVVVVITARRSAFLEADLPKLKDLARESRKPVFMWTYTLPSPRTDRDSQRDRLSAVHQRAGLRAHAARDGRLSSFARTFAAPDRNRAGGPGGARRCSGDAGGVGRSCANTGRGRCWRPTASVPTMPGNLVHSAGEAAEAAQAIGRPVALKVQSADIPHKTDAGAVALDLAGADTIRAAYDRVLAAARQHAPIARIDGVLVQPMAPPGREVILGVNRDPTWGLLLMVGLGRRSGRGAR